MTGFRIDEHLHGVITDVIGVFPGDPLASSSASGSGLYVLLGIFYLREERLREKSGLC